MLQILYNIMNDTYILIYSIFYILLIILYNILYNNDCIQYFYFFYYA